MSYIIVHTTNSNVRKYLERLSGGRTSESLVFDINAKTKVFQNNGLVLAYISNLLNKYPNEVYVWVAERMTLHEFPNECKKAGSWLSERANRNLRYIPDKEALVKCKINFSVNSKG